MMAPSVCIFYSGFDRLGYKLQREATLSRQGLKQSLHPPGSVACFRHGVSVLHELPESTICRVHLHDDLHGDVMCRLWVCQARLSVQQPRVERRRE